ncbi:ESX secretion-associated protein EspG [Nocardia farcinica]|uniref:ESX secretion-associated protein EspG n=1 Tax=Nocardia TaxID=1817 RepID=UPI000BF028A4|nr:MULTISPECIES: ESX secretion-associated protein EspG [Nocardia]MBF6069393.1 ESX secretion-associated protein EspG [Nocardia farcinica]MBF6187471.1 ESX secretion-associated protein EspG [Nocardia farcinica]MBF6232670.1 ESX secretion-associated protein EspG [Nocardia farcinica]MBF6292241.1 ESX secretion-associated protein EspG [Nocardia farcinica]MBF6314670.1 ESX secretion-associated protein EspG [Nocardia farcinica]
MNRTWEFTDLEFRVLCERYGDSRIPEPLTYLARIRYAEDYDRAKFEVWERLRATADPDLREIIPILIRPEVSVRVLTWYDRGRDDPALWVRARGGRTGARGYLVVQKPGETVEHSGGYVIHDCGPRGLAEAIVRLLPPGVEAGRAGSIPVVAEHVDDLESYGGVRSLVTDDRDDSGIARSRRFFETPAERTGAVTVHQGHSRYGPRGIIEHILLWRDLPGDGRYVIELPSAAPMAVGMGRKWLTKKIDDAVETMLDRTESHWELRG